MNSKQKKYIILEGLIALIQKKFRYCFLYSKYFNNLNKMQYSEIIPEANNQKHAPNSSFFVYSNGNILYVKESSVDLRNISVINVGSSIKNFQISPNSKYIAVFCHKKSAVFVYKIDGVCIAKIEDGQAGIASYFWAQDSIQLLVFSEFMYKVSIYNLSTSKVAYIKGPKLNSSKGCAFNSDGKFMALLQKHDCKDYLTVYYTVDWKVLNAFQLDLFDAVEVRWSPNDGYLVAWDNCINYKLVVLCHIRGQVMKYEPYNYALGIKAVDFSHNSLFLAVGSFDEKIRLLNAITWQQIGELDCSNPIINGQKIAIYKQEQYNANNSMMKQLIVSQFKIPTMKVNISNEKLPNQGISMIEFSPDDQYLACRNDNMPYTVWIWNVSTLLPVSIICCGSHIKSFKWVQNHQMLSVIAGNDKVLLWNREKDIQECMFNFQNNKFNIQKMLWSQDGKRMLISNKTDLVYVQLLHDFQ